MSRIRRRLSALAATVVLATGSGLALATPAHAATTITINSATVVNFTLVRVNVTYTCDANSGVKFIVADVTVETETARVLGTGSEDAVCNGVSHTTDVPAAQLIETGSFVAGDPARVFVFLANANLQNLGVASDIKRLTLMHK